MESHKIRSDANENATPGREYRVTRCQDRRPDRNRIMLRGGEAKCFLLPANVCVRIERLGADFPCDICPSVSMLACGVRRNLLVFGGLERGQSGLISECVGDEASYAERGMLFLVFIFGYSWLVCLTAVHVMAWDLGGIGGFAFLEIENVQKIVDVLRRGELYKIACYCDF